MIATERLVYLELQKTGCSHIRRLLVEYVGARTSGKHNRPCDRDIADRFVIGSVRNPWDWYVSLWAFGVTGQGAIRHRTQRRADLLYYHSQLPKAMGKNWLSIMEWIMSLAHDSVKPVSKWQSCYENADDREMFRTWLKLILDPSRRFDIGEGYAFSPVSKHGGLLTYRYLRLFTLGEGIYKDRRLAMPSGIEKFDREENVVSAFIRTEKLEVDFIEAVESAGYDLDESTIDRIMLRSQDKTNVSERRTAEYYFDEESSRLIAQREAYIIDKFGYKAP